MTKCIEFPRSRWSCPEIRTNAVSLRVRVALIAGTFPITCLAEGASWHRGIVAYWRSEITMCRTE